MPPPPLALLQAQWASETAAPLSQLDLPEFLRAHRAPIRSSRRRAARSTKASARPRSVLEATYFVPYVSNAPMEPRAAVARWDGDRLTVWAGSQRPFGIRTELAQRLRDR